MYVYIFEEGSSALRSLLGGKGADLAEMTALGLSVPPGLTVTTDACNYYSSHGSKFPEGLEQEIANKLRIVESKSGRVFGDVNNPLLVSVRSGAPISMPGMMDTVLNLGLNDSTIQGLIRQTNEPSSVEFCHEIGIDYVSCSPYRVPITRLVAAQAVARGRTAQTEENK